MIKAQNPKQNSKYDLEARTLKFAKAVRAFARKLLKTIANIEDGKQLIRASGSVGANYIEANEAISKKDFLLRIKICRKEAKESWFWLNLVFTGNDDALEEERLLLEGEALELAKIFSSILEKSK
jgi:four helix bundle protein